MNLGPYELGYNDTNQGIPMRWCAGCQQYKNEFCDKYCLDCEEEWAKERILQRGSSLFDDKAFCVHCKQIKPNSAFYKNKAYKNGLQPRCKKCFKLFRTSLKYDVTEILVEEKRCTKCKLIKPPGEFHRNRRAKDGLNGWCKECVSLNQKRKYVPKPRKPHKLLPRIMVSEAKCSICKQVRPANEFGADETRAHGLSSWCKDCRRERGREYRQRDPERTRRNQVRSHERYKEKYHNDPEYKEKCLAREREYSKRPKVKDRKNKSLQEWKKTPKGQAYVRRHNHTRQARALGLPADFTPSEWKDALSYFGYQCAYCGRADMKLHQEHFVPVTLGGGYTRTNIVPACPRCNARKSNHDSHTWCSANISNQNHERILQYLSS